VVFAGRIDTNKGVDTLVDAACILAEDFGDLRLRVIGAGDPNFIELLRTKSRDAGYPNLIEFVGYVQRPDLPAHLKEADVFAAPSVYEGGPGFVYLEAMACGLPVIACKGNGASECVRHDETGFLIEPRDVRALVHTLRLLLSKTDLRRSMGLRARRFVEAEADSRDCLTRLESFYTAVARPGASERGFAAAAQAEPAFPSAEAECVPSATSVVKP
jgi:glycosyltransferase involved in cell wall biosynthesis